MKPPGRDTILSMSRMKKIYLLLCAGAFVCLAVAVRARILSEHRCKIAGPILSVEEVALETAKYDGQHVRIVGYFTEGHEGPSVSSLPKSVANHLNPETKLFEIRGCWMLARLADSGALGGLPKKYFLDSRATSEKLALVEGVVHKPGYGKDDKMMEMIHEVGYIEVERVWIISEIIAEKSVDGECHCESNL